MPRADAVQRGDAVGRRHHAMALVLEKMIEKVAHFGIVLDDQDRAGAASLFNGRRPIAFRRRRDLVRQERHLDGKDRPLARLRTDVDLVAEQIRQAMHDGEAEAEAAAALTRGVVELVILVEDRFQFSGRDTIAGIANLDG